MTQIVRSRNITIDVLRVLGIFCIMLIHTPVVVDAEKAPFIYIVREFLARGAVPAFFILSGYLVVRKMKDRSVSFRSFFGDKFHKLILPYLLWNGLLIVIVLAMKQADIGTSMAQGGAYLSLEPTFSSIMTSWLGINKPPIVYQFWFLRDLILAMLALFYVIRYLPPLPFLWLILLLTPYHMMASFGFFLLGCQLYEVVSLKELPKVRSCYLYWAGWVLIGVAFTLGYVNVPIVMKQLGSAVFLLFSAVILSSWKLTARLAVLGPAVLFVSAAHEPLQTMVGRMWEKYNLPGFGYTPCFLLIPLIAGGIILACYYIMKQWFPKTLSVFTGVRS